MDGGMETGGGGKGVRTLFSGLADEESPPSSSFTAHSGTALRTPEGELALRGTRGYSIDHDARHGPEPPKKSPDTSPDTFSSLESVANIASTGEVTFGDAIGLLGPLAHALGQRTGKMLSNGGCFVAGTPVSLSSLPRGWQPRASDPWSQPQWLEQLLGEESDFFGVAVGPALAQAGVVLAPAVERVAIDAVPLGGRVPTRNPRRWEYDGSLPEPDEANWAKLSITVQRSDGGVVDAELLRPRAWIELHGIVAGQLLPLHLPELEVSGQALVTAVDSCPPIASGAGSVVTARFVTREVHVVASVDVLGPNGSIETITGTTIHPVWSVDREDWVPLGELVQGETLQGQSGVAVVLSVTLSRVAQPVYNLEVHGEHVYQVGELGVLVHNAGEECELLRNAPKGPVQSQHFSTSAQGRALHETGQSYRDAAKLGPYRNVATADVTVNGVRKTVRFKNDPDGMHSEQRLVAWHKLMTERARKVEVHGVFSERPPCGPMSANCRETLGNYFGQFLDVWHGNR